MAATATPVKRFGAGGMEISWHFAADEIYITVSAPARGWLAFGFNLRAGLTGTNFVMAAIETERVKFTDRTIVTPGDHRELPAGCVRLIDAREEQNSTVMRFALKIHTRNQFHFELAPGKKLYLLLAYSREKDFAHHSAYRETLEIEL